MNKQRGPEDSLWEFHNIDNFPFQQPTSSYITPALETFRSDGRAGSFSLKFNISDQIHSSLRDIAQEILPLASHYTCIQKLIQNATNTNCTQVLQALNAALGNLLHDYYKQDLRIAEKKMVLRVYNSGMSGDKEVKKRQQRVLMILDSKHIKYEVVDITEPCRESDKEFMQNNATNNGATVSDPHPKNPLPPQIFNDENYCGDYEAFDLANEIDSLDQFLKLVPAAAAPVSNAEQEMQGNNVDLKSNGENKENEVDETQNDDKVEASSDDKVEDEEKVEKEED